MTRPERRRLDVADRRAQLLEIGGELFGTQPYEDVWIDHVAERAGVSTGLLYHYFGNKRDFLVAVVEREVQALREATAAAPDPHLTPREAVCAALDGYLAHVAARPYGYRAVHQGAVGADPRVRDLRVRSLRRQEELFLAELTPEPSELLRVAVHGWFAFLVATCLRWLDDPTLDRDALRDLCVAMAHAAITAAGHPSPLGDDHPSGDQGR